MCVSMEHFEGQKRETFEKYLKLHDVYDKMWDKLVSCGKKLREEKVLRDERLYQNALDEYCAVMEKYQEMRKELAQLAHEMGKKK